MNIFKYQLKTLIRSKSIIFWSLLFPIILGTFFNMAFSNLESAENFQKIKIALVGSDKSFESLIGNLEDLFEYEVLSLDDAKKALDDNKISGYYEINETITTHVKGNGTNSTIMKYVLDNYYIYTSVGMNIYEMKGVILKDISDNNFFNDISNAKVDNTVIYFYSLIGMVCIQAGSFGINAVSTNEANLSKKGARLSVSPTNKLFSLLISLLVALIVQYIELIVILSYFIFILGVNFGYIPQILLISLFGILAGISLGTVVAISNKKKENFKQALLMVFVMSCSFLSGMMAVQIKYLMETKFPILAKINPVSLVTDGLLSLYYEDTSRYFSNILSLFIFSFVMIVIAYSFARRKKYDSI